MFPGNLKFAGAHGCPLFLFKKRGFNRGRCQILNLKFLVVQKAEVGPWKASKWPILVGFNLKMADFSFIMIGFSLKIVDFSL